jgi:hypothetical protein
MTRCLLTQELVDTLTPKDKLFDMTAVGHPGFGLRTHPSGRKNWFYRYRIKDSVRMVILGQTSWMKFGLALTKYKNFRDMKLQGIEPKGVNPTAMEADFLYFKLFDIVDSRQGLPSALREDPTIEKFADYFNVHTTAVKKLAAYDQLKLFPKDGNTCVRAYPLTIKTSFLNGLEIL